MSREEVEARRLHKTLRTHEVYVLDLHRDKNWRRIVAALVVCPNCQAKYADAGEPGKTLSGFAFEWVPGENAGEYVLYCQCGKQFPEKDWLAPDAEVRP